MSSILAHRLILRTDNVHAFTTVFIDAPHLLTPIDPQGEPVFSTSEQYSMIKNLDPKQPTKHTPRGWFYHTHTADDAWAVSKSLVYLRGVLEKEGPFNVSTGDLTDRMLS